MQAQRIKFVKSLGIKPTIDLEVNHSDHNFYGDGCVISNSHSKAYSFVTMYCAWYKANKPKEFFLGALKLALSETKPQEIISEISQELPRFGIKLLPPDLSRSSMEFKIEDGNIRFGLSAIKGIGEKKLEALQKFRDAKKPNKYDIFLSAKQAEIGIGVLSSLIQAGTLDSFGEKRVDLVLEAQVFNKLSDREKKLFIALGEKYNNSVIKTIKACTEEKLVDEKGKPIISDKRLITLRKECSKYFEIRKLNSEHQSLASWYFERKLLGYSYSIRLRDCFQQGMLGSENLAKMEDWQKGVFVGVVTEVNKSVSKKGSAYMKITLSDENGMFNVMMIDNKRSQKFTEYINAGGVTPEEEDIIIVYGSKSGDIIFIDSIKIVSDEIYMKLSDSPDGKSVKSQEAVSTTSSA